MFFLPSNATIPEPGNGTSQRTNPLGAVKQVKKRWWSWREVVVVEERGGGGCFVCPLCLRAAMLFSLCCPRLREKQKSPSIVFARWEEV